MLKVNIGEDGKPRCSHCGELLDSDDPFFSLEGPHSKCSLKAMRKETRERKSLLRELINEADAQPMPDLPQLDKREQKKIILKKYLDKEPTAFRQFDAFFWEPNSGDDFFPADEQGVASSGSNTFELMSGKSNVRVLVVPGSSKHQVIHALKNLIECIERYCGDTVELLSSKIPGDEEA